MFSRKRKNLLGVDIGTSSVKIVKLQAEKGGGYSLSAIGVIETKKDTITRDQLTLDPEHLAEITASLAAKLGIKNTDVACAIPSHFAIIKNILLPYVPEEELPEVVMHEAAQYIPLDLSSIEVDYHVTMTISGDISKTELILVAAKKELTEKYQEIFAKTGLSLKVLDIDCFAIQNCFEINYPEYLAQTVAILDVGARYATLNIAKDGQSHLVRTVQLADGAPKQESDGTTTSGPSEQEMQANCSLIIQELKKAILHEVREDGVEKILITGGGCRNKYLEHALTQDFHLPVEYLDPFHNITVNEEVFSPKYMARMTPLMTVAVGLALREAKP